MNNQPLPSGRLLGLPNTSSPLHSKHQGGSGASSKRHSPEGGFGDMAAPSKRSKEDGPPLVVFRLLCPSARTGSIIGKGGDIIRQLRAETGSRIKIEEAVDRCDERIVAISAPERASTQWSPAQEALFRVHSRIIEGDSEDTNLKDLVITARLLVDSSQIGCVLGKGGTIITQLRQDTGASIRILSSNEKPLCASPCDELVQITGEPAKVRMALQHISAQLKSNPPRHFSQHPRTIALTASSATGSAADSAPVPVFAPAARRPPTPPSSSGDGRLRSLPPPHPGSSRDELQRSQSHLTGPYRGQAPPHMMGMEQGSVLISFRLLVPLEHAGRVIGRSGEVIKQIRQQTNARVKMHEPTDGSEERVVAISSLEPPATAYSPAEEALLRCCAAALAWDTTDEEDKPEMQVLRLLVTSNQVGCVLGHGGTVVAQVRALTGCQVHVFGGNDRGPTLAPADAEQVVQMEGTHMQCLMAVRQVRAATRLAAAEGPPEGQGLQLQPSLLPMWGLQAGSTPLAAMLGHPMMGGSSDLQMQQPMPMQPMQQPVQPLPGQLQMAGLQPGSVTAMLGLSGVQVGSVLGRQGCNIQQIRQISGARVKLHPPSTPGSTDRCLEINGSILQTTPAVRINSLDVHRTEDLLVTAGEDDALRVYSTQSGVELNQIWSKRHGICHITYTHDPQGVVYASNKGEHIIRYLSMWDNKYQRYFKGHVQEVTTLAMNPKNDMLLSGARDNQVRLWDLRTPACQGILNTPGPACAGFDQQGLVFGVAVMGGTIKLFDSRNYQQGPFDAFGVASESKSMVSHLRFSPDGKQLVVVCGSRVHMLDAFTGVRKFTVTTGSEAMGPAMEPAFSPDGQYFGSGCADRAVRFWRCHDGTEAAALAGHAGPPACLKWHPRRMVFASACSALAFWTVNPALL